MIIKLVFSFARHMKIHTWCSICNAIVTKSQHHHKEEKSKNDQPIFVQAFVPVIIPFTKITPFVNNIKDDAFYEKRNLIYNELFSWLPKPERLPSDDLLELYFDLSLTTLNVEFTSSEEREAMKRDVFKLIKNHFDK